MISSASTYCSHRSRSDSSSSHSLCSGLLCFPLPDTSSAGFVFCSRFSGPRQNCLLYLFQVLFYASTPAEGVPSGTALYLRPVDKDGLVVCFSLLLQQTGILVEQILDLRRAPLLKPGNRALIRHRFAIQQPDHVDSIFTRVYNLAVAVDMYFVRIGQYLEQHPRVGDGISSFRRERAVQSPVIQLLKLRVCQPDGCILWYYFFCVQSKFS